MALNHAPLTTGELSSKFSHLSRFAIMKHLGILEKANLITTKKEGKFRWNYLNTVPFRQTYEEWLKQLVQLKYLAIPSEEAMMESEKQPTTTRVQIELPINALKVEVWNVLTQQTGQWWLRSYFTHQKTKEMIMEAKLGGMLYERIGAEQGIVWASVIALEVPEFIQFMGYLRPVPNSGPAISFLRLDLETVKAHPSSRTKLILTDDIMANISEKDQKELTERWRRLLTDGLKSFIEQ